MLKKIFSIFREVETMPDVEQIRVIVGLGNPGLEYQRTRHNIGFTVLDAIGTANGATFQSNSRLKCEFAKFEYRGKTIMLVKPTTYMNLSGECVIAVKQWFKLPVASFFVVHDDVALPLGKIRVVNGGGAGGQHGIESIIECLGGDKSMDRLKFGVGPDPGGDKRAHYVLSKIPEAQQELLSEAILLSTKAIFTWINDGAKTAMDRFNSQDLRPEAKLEAEEKRKKKEAAKLQRELDLKETASSGDLTLDSSSSSSENL